MYHPLHRVLYAALPFAWAFNLELLLSYPALLLGTFLLLRRRSLPIDASLLGAYGFAFAGFAVFHYMHLNAVAVVAHFPYALLAIDWLMRAQTPTGRAWGGLALAVVTGSELLLGYPQYVYFSLLAEGLYAALVWSEMRGWPRWLPALVAAKVLGIGLGAVQLLPTADALADSVRDAPTPEFLAMLSLPPRNIVLWLVPYLYKTRVFAPAEELEPSVSLGPATVMADCRVHEYGVYSGVAAPVLLVWVLLRFRWLHHRRLAAWALGLGAIGLALAFGDFTPLFAVTCRLPGLNLFRVPARHIVLVHLATAILVAIGFTDLRAFCHRGERLAWRRLWPLALPPLGSLAIVAAAHIGAEIWLGPHQSSDQALAASVGLVVGASALVAVTARRSTWALTGLAALIVVDVGTYSVTYLASGSRTSLSQIAADHRPVSRSNAERAMISAGSPAADNMWMFTGRGLVSGYAGLTPRQALDLNKPAVQRAAGVRWSIGAATTALPEPLPRPRLVTRSRVSADPNIDIDAIDPGVEALVPSPLPLVGGVPGSATITRDEPGNICVVAEAATRQLLVLAERYHRGWTVTVDGHPRRVHRVYGDFMGCLVEPGRHKVRFRFRPQSLAVGRAVSLAALGLVIAWPPLTRLRHRAGRAVAASSGSLGRTDRSPAGSRDLPAPHLPPGGVGLFVTAPPNPNPEPDLIRGAS